MDQSIDALFGSKTRVKLLNLFLNNPGKTFYVREITRLIDEQVNSVRRELNNLESVGVVKNTTQDRKSYYGVNQRFKFYIPLRAIFAGTEIIEEESDDERTESKKSWKNKISDIKKSLQLMAISGVLVDGSESEVDMLLVGDNENGAISEWASKIEEQEGRELNYVILSMTDFYYRYSTRDVFISGIFKSKHRVILDEEEILKNN